MLLGGELACRDLPWQGFKGWLGVLKGRISIGYPSALLMHQNEIFFFYFKKAFLGVIGTIGTNWISTICLPEEGDWEESGLLLSVPG